MQVERIQVTIGGTVNVGDYSNVKLEITLEAVLEPGVGTYSDDIENASKSLRAQAWDMYSDEVLRLAERNYTAQSYLAVIAPDVAAALRERKKAEMANRTKASE